VRQVQLPKSANLNVHQPLRRSLQELNELCRTVGGSQSSTPAADDSSDGKSLPAHTVACRTNEGKGKGSVECSVEFYPTAKVMEDNYFAENILHTFVVSGLLHDKNRICDVKCILM